GPGRMRGRVDVELKLVALLAVGRIRDEFRPIGHLDRDLVIVGVQVGVSFHRLSSLVGGLTSRTAYPRRKRPRSARPLKPALQTPNSGMGFYNRDVRLAQHRKAAPL